MRCDSSGLDNDTEWRIMEKIDDRVHTRIHQHDRPGERENRERERKTARHTDMNEIYVYIGGGVLVSAQP